MEIQSLAQIGLTNTKDVYVQERYERLRDISAEMLAKKTGFNLEKVKIYFVMKQDIKHQNSIQE